MRAIRLPMAVCTDISSHVTQYECLDPVVLLVVVSQIYRLWWILELDYFDLVLSNII